MANDVYTTGKVYQYETEFFGQPSDYGDVVLFQMGELCCECSFAIKPHKQVCHEISVVISGEGTFYTNDTPTPVQAGHVILNRIDDIHSIVSSNISRLRFLYIGFMFKEDVDPSMEEVRRFFANPFPSNAASDTLRLTDHMQLLMNEFYSRDTFSHQMSVSYIVQILVRAFRLFHVDKKWHGMPVQPVHPSYAVNSTVYRTLKYIDDNIVHIKTVAAITRELGYSYCYMSHVFKDKTGITIQGYINQKKIQKSMELMDSGLHTITKIAEDLQYSSVQAFSKAFKREMGYSPRAYTYKRRQE